MATLQAINATGRRKTAVATVHMAAGSGKITVNGRGFEQYFPIEDQRAEILQPFKATDTSGKFDLRAHVAGGGPHGQAGALRLGISRALLQTDENFRKLLREHGLLTRDPRRRERKKYGQPGARKRFQFSKR
ncbi:MAG: 30S ribosomal protein S9 [Verrucomicrobia bacterium]|nr:30S ribosomal protein S9 [Verrucomicrobiota bacterium]